MTDNAEHTSDFGDPSQDMSAEVRDPAEVVQGVISHYEGTRSTLLESMDNQRKILETEGISHNAKKQASSDLRKATQEYNEINKMIEDLRATEKRERLNAAHPQKDKKAGWSVRAPSPKEQDKDREREAVAAIKTALGPQTIQAGRSTVLRLIKAQEISRKAEIEPGKLADIVVDQCDYVLRTVLEQLKDSDDKYEWDAVRDQILAVTETQDEKIRIFSHKPKQGRQSLAAYMNDLEQHKQALFFHLGLIPKDGIDWPDLHEPSEAHWATIWKVGLEGLRDTTFRDALKIERTAEMAKRRVEKTSFLWTLRDWQVLNLSLQAEHPGAFEAQGAASSSSATASPTTGKGSPSAHTRDKGKDRKLTLEAAKAAGVCMHCETTWTAGHYDRCPKRPSRTSSRPDDSRSATPQDQTQPKKPFVPKGQCFYGCGEQNWTKTHYLTCTAMTEDERAKEAAMYGQTSTNNNKSSTSSNKVSTAAKSPSAPTTTPKHMRLIGSPHVMVAAIQDARRVAPEEEQHRVKIFSGTMNGASISTPYISDSGSTSDFITTHLADQLGLEVHLLREPITFRQRHGEFKVQRLASFQIEVNGTPAIVTAFVDDPEGGDPLLLGKGTSIRLGIMDAEDDTPYDNLHPIIRIMNEGYVPSDYITTNIPDQNPQLKATQVEGAGPVGSTDSTTTTPLPAVWDLKTAETELHVDISKVECTDETSALTQDGITITLGSTCTMPVSSTSSYKMQDITSLIVKGAKRNAEIEAEHFMADRTPIPIYPKEGTGPHDLPQSQSYPLNAEQRKVAEEWAKTRTAQGAIESILIPGSNGVLPPYTAIVPGFVTKSVTTGKSRVVLNMVKLNTHIDTERYIKHNPQTTSDLVQRLIAHPVPGSIPAVGSTYRGKKVTGHIITYVQLDDKNAYEQIPISQTDGVQIIATIDNKYYKIRSLPQGANMSTYSYNHIVAADFSVVDGVEGALVVNFFDDIVAKITLLVLEDGIVLDPAYRVIELIFETINNRKTQHIISIEKSVFLGRGIKFGGRTLTEGRHHYDPRLLVRLGTIQTPTRAEGLRRVAGIFNAWSEYMKGGTMVLKTVHRLAGKEGPLSEVATPEEIKAIEEEIKLAGRLLAESQCLHAYDPTQQTFLATDGSKRGFGYVVLQRPGPRNDTTAYTINPDNIYENTTTVALGGRSTTTTESRYPAFKLELCAALHGLRQTDAFLRQGFFALLTDHQALVRAAVLENPAPVLTRMLDEFNSYWCVVIHVVGATFGTPDEISRVFSEIPIDRGELEAARSDETAAELIAKGIPAKSDPKRFNPGTYISKSIDEYSGERPDHPTIMKIGGGGWAGKSTNNQEHEDEEPRYGGPPGSLEALMAKSASKEPIVGKGKRDSQGHLFPPRATPGVRPWRPGDPFYVIPDGDVEAIISEIHLQGHTGISSTIRRIHSLGWTAPAMASRIKDYITKCLICLRWNIGKGGYIPRPWPYPTVGTALAWSIDYKDMPMDDMGCTAILAAVDVFSYYVRLFATKDKTAASTAEAMIDIVFTFGPPAYIVTDNATSFVNEVMTEVCARAGTEHRTITPYNHRGNTRAENGILRVRQTLAKALDGDYTMWSRRIRPIEYVLNTTTLPEIKTTPYRLMFCREAPLTFRDYSDIVFPDIEEIHIDKRLEEANYVQDVVLPAMAEDKYQQGLTRLRPPASRLVHKVGDIVMYRDRAFSEGRSKDPAQPEWLGPAQVVHVQGDVYTLMDNDGIIIKSTFLGGDLKKTGLDALDSDDTYVVKRIHDEREGRNGKSEYLTEWEGYPSRHDWTWEPDGNFYDRGIIAKWTRIKERRSVVAQQTAQQSATSPTGAKIATAASAARARGERRKNIF